MITKKDYFIAAGAGIITAVFLMPMVYRFGWFSGVSALMFFFGLPILWAFGVWLGKFLGRFFRFFNQFGKFVAVGFMNASIDFGILNILSIFTSTTSGLFLGWINIPGFLAAATNSYFWNKFWVFENSREGFGDAPKFTLVTILGVALNSLIVVSFTTYIGPQFGASSALWLNLSKAAASASVLLWNFIGYKFFAFKK